MSEAQINSLSLRLIFKIIIIINKFNTTTNFLILVIYSTCLLFRVYLVGGNGGEYR